MTSSIATPGTPATPAKPSKQKELTELQLLKRSRKRSIALHLTLALSAIIALSPVVFIVANSFTPEAEILRRLDTTGSVIERVGAVADKAVPEEFSLENYRSVLDRNSQGELEFLGWFVNSVVIALATCAIGIFLAATAGYALSRYRFPGYKPTLYLFLVTQMFPGIILIVPLFNLFVAAPIRQVLLLPALGGLIVGLAVIIRRLRAKQWTTGIGYIVGGAVGALLGLVFSFSLLLLVFMAAIAVAWWIDHIRTRDPRLLAARTGVFAAVGFGLVAYALGSAPTELRLLDNRWGLVLAYSTIAVPFCVYMLKGYFDTIPHELEQAGLVDGLTPFGTFWRIACPLALPGIAVTAFYSFITAWNEFMYAITFNLSSENYTLPAGLATYVSQFRTEWGQFSAAAVLVSIPALGFFFFAQRFLVGGLTAGGTKT